MMTEQRAAIGKKLHDDRIGFEDVLAFVFGQSFGVDAVVVERRVDFEAVFLAGIEVVRRRDPERCARFRCPDRA